MRLDSHGLTTFTVRFARTDAQRFASRWPCSTLKGPERACPDCRAQRQVKTMCDALGLTVEFAGDPRGMPFKVERVAQAVRP